MDERKTGKINKDADGYTVQFERHYPYDVMTVWDAITNPSKLAVWFMEVDMELKPGSIMVIYHNKEKDDKSFGKVLTIEPGKLFEYEWDNDSGPSEITRWELFPDGPSACRLVFTHSRIDESYVKSVPGGWHIMLDHLEKSLTGSNEIVNEEEESSIKTFYKELIQKTFKTLFK